MNTAFYSLSSYFRRFFSGVMLSRISGYGRDLSMAMAFGDHPSVAAFLIAFRFSNLMRRLVAEGPFQSIFVPHFEGLRIKHEGEALAFFRSLIFLVLIFLTIICLFVELGITFYLTSPDIAVSSREILVLTKWLFPSIIFICLYGLNNSLLSCYDIFFIPSLAPIVCNCAWIAGAFMSYGTAPELAMLTIAKYVLIGYVGQWLFTMPQALKKILFRIKGKKVFTIPPEVINLLKSFSLGAIGVGAIQLNVFADSLFARFASESGPVYLWYSIRMQQLVIALFGIACVTTVAPRLARAIKNKDQDLATALFSFSYKRILLIMMPCTFAIFALAASSVNLLYGRGAFTNEAIIKTALCLWAYGLGLIPVVMIMLYTSYFFALHKLKLPTIISIASVMINLLFNSVFVFALELGALSVAIATSISAWVNFLVLYHYAKKEDLNLTYSFSRIRRLFLVCISSFAVFVLIEPILFQETISMLFTKNAVFSKSFTKQVYQFFLQAGLFMSCLFAFSKAFKCHELLELRELFIPKKSTKMDQAPLN